MQWYKLLRCAKMLDCTLATPSPLPPPPHKRGCEHYTACWAFPAALTGPEWQLSTSLQTSSTVSPLNEAPVQTLPPLSTKWMTLNPPPFLFPSPPLTLWMFKSLWPWHRQLVRAGIKAPTGPLLRGLAASLIRRYVAVNLRRVARGVLVNVGQSRHHTGAQSTPGVAQLCRHGPDKQVTSRLK